MLIHRLHGFFIYGFTDLTNLTDYIITTTDFYLRIYGFNGFYTATGFYLRI